MSRRLGPTDNLPLAAKRHAVAISWDHDPRLPVDVDLQAVVVDNRGSIIDAVYYNNLKGLGKCMTHSGDEVTGQKTGYDETVWVNLDRLPETVQMIVFVIATHTGHLKDVKNGMIHILLERSDNELGCIPMENSVEEVDMVAAMIRYGGSWCLRVIDEPAQDGRHFMDILEPSIGNFIRKHIPSAPRRMKVAFAMEKGGVLDLPRSNQMNNIVAGLGWDVMPGAEGVDLDVSAVLIDTSSQVAAAVFFGNLEELGVKHTGDNLTGEGEGDDEQIICNLQNIPDHICQIFFVVNIYTRGVTFQQVRNAFCRIMDSDCNELARYTLSEGGMQNGLIISRLFREVDGRWGFQAIGEFARGTMYKDSIPEVMRFVPVLPTSLQGGPSSVPRGEDRRTVQEVPKGGESCGRPRCAQQ